MAVDDRKEFEMDREDGLLRDKPDVALLRHIHEVWPPVVNDQGDKVNAAFLPTADLITKLVTEHPKMWGPNSSYGRALTSQRLGSMLAKGYKIHTKRAGHGTPRGYFLAAFVRPWNRMGITPPTATGSTGESGETGEPGPDSPDEPVEPVEPVTGEGLGASASTGHDPVPEDRVAAGSCASGFVPSSDAYAADQH